MTEPDDPHARHTPDQIAELQDAFGHVADALEHLHAEILADFENSDLEHAIRHLKEARLWLNEILLTSGHEPEERADDHAGDESERPPPIH